MPYDNHSYQKHVAQIQRLNSTENLFKTSIVSLPSNSLPQFDESSVSGKSMTDHKLKMQKINQRYSSHERMGENKSNGIGGFRNYFSTNS